VSDFSHQSKTDLRRWLLAARRSRPDLAEADAGVRAELATLATGLGTVAAYAPLPREPGGAALPAALAAVCARLLLPVVRTDLDLDWAEYTGTLTPAAFGLSEPPGVPLGPAAIASADLVIVPALAVDRRGVRLGRGGGSYDRALTRLIPGTVVVAALYEGELVPLLPAEPHDVRVGLVVTPSGLTRL
jgi:5-formyltetrahydrofolate cyclo-ligase